MLFSSQLLNYHYDYDEKQIKNNSLYKEEAYENHRKLIDFEMYQLDYLLQSNVQYK